MVAEAVLGLVLVVCVCFDLKERRIPNWITVPGLAAGLALHTWLGGTGGLVNALAGAAFGAAVMAIPFSLSWVGGGDLKLLAAIGALMGATFTMTALLFGLAAGGLMALGWLAFTGNLARSLRYLFLVWLPMPRVKPAALSSPIPFGPALALGVLVAMFWRWG